MACFDEIERFIIHKKIPCIIHFKIPKSNLIAFIYIVYNQYQENLESTENF